MSEISQIVLERLAQMNIAVRTIDHEPAATIEQCAALEERIGAMICKNYFLTTKNHSVHCLCVTRPNARFRTADISRQAGTSRLSFADGEELYRLLRTRPGSVSPMGLMFDEEKNVRLLVDAALKDQAELAFHPCDNTQTLAMSSRDFLNRFLAAVGHEPTFVEIHDFL